MIKYETDLRNYVIHLFFVVIKKVRVIFENVPYTLI